MPRKFLFIGGGIILLIAIGVLLVLRGRVSSNNAGILIETDPQATVFLDGEQVGTTPFKLERKPGEVTVKLIPFAENSPLVPYETKATLIDGIQTVVRRNFSASEEQSAGEVLFFEEIGGRTSSVSIVSSPDATQVALDGKSSGFTPLKIDAVDPGQHQLVVSATGYQSRNIDVRTIAGYKLVAVVKLAKNNEDEKKEEPKEQEQIKKKTVIKILDTPTGFLRVREQPSTLASESAQVTPGKTYPFIEENQDSSWFKIEYLPAQAGEEGETGWVSSQYAQKVEE